MRVCDRCKTPEKRSTKTLRDQHGGEIELCRDCDTAFIAWLDAPQAKRESEKQAGKSARK